MSQRPYVLLSVATSIDGYIDDVGGSRLVLSGPEDLDRVDEVRAGVDAILVGANTVRTDNPRLLVRSDERRAERVARGLPADPAKVTITGTGRLDPDAAFFALGDGPKLVYALSPVVAAVSQRLGQAALVVDAGDPLDLPRLLADLLQRGVRRLMVEGGSAVHTMFLSGGLVDELQLVVAPIFVGDPQAPRFVRTGVDGRMTLAEVRQIGDCALLRYLPAGAHG